MALVLVGTPIGNLGDLSPARSRRCPAPTSSAARTPAARGGSCSTPASGAARCWWSTTTTRPPRSAPCWPGSRWRAGRRGHRRGHARHRRPRRAPRAGRPAGRPPVEVVPGPSAAIAAVVASGLSTARFVFEGFLPRKGSGRTERLAEVARERRTVVLYEAPHRVAGSRRPGRVGRRRATGRRRPRAHQAARGGVAGTLADAIEWVAAEPPRGELVLVLDGAPPDAPASDKAVDAAVQARLDAGNTTRCHGHGPTQLGVPAHPKAAC